MTDDQILKALKNVLGKALFGEEATKGKEFYIPINVDSKTQFWGVYLRDLVFFIPIFCLAILLFFLRVNWILQLLIDFSLLTITFCLITIRPLRRDIPAWKHLVWMIRYDKRQKRFLYRKKGVK